MIAKAELPPFVLPRLRLDQIETALTEKRYMVTLVGKGQRFMIAPKLADIIIELQQEKSIEEVARQLSLSWQQEVSPEVLCQIIEKQMIPRGIAFPADELPVEQQIIERFAVTNQKPLRERFQSGNFHWRLLKKQTVETICTPLTIFYEPFSVLLAIALIASTRWMLYSTTDWHFVTQLMTVFSPSEYLLSLGLLIVVVLFHEFGHAAAQLHFKLPAGGIGFLLYRYIPGLFANVDASWRLKPSRRMVVDIGGLYFQGIATSILYLLYLKTHFLPFLTTAIFSDLLSLVALNPFLRFDGYWLLCDALAIPNLHKLSNKLQIHYWERVIGREATASEIPSMAWSRKMAVTAFGFVRNCFWVLLVLLIAWKTHYVLAIASNTLLKLVASIIEGIRTWNVLLISASLTRMLLFTLLLMGLSILVGRMALKLWRLLRHIGRVLRGRNPMTDQKSVQIQG